MNAAGGGLQLRTLLGDYPHTRALKRGAIASPVVSLSFADYTPTNRGFKPMVREQAFDVSEMAIVTYLMAKAHEKPMVLLPAAVMSRFQHAYALYNRARGELCPEDLPGKRVGIRSFTTTTGAWLRGILANDHGVDLGSIHWITFEDPHVAEYIDTTERAPAGTSIIQMLIDGEIDAAIGEVSDHPQLRPLFGDPAEAARAWRGRHGVVPVNHMVVVSAKLARERPDAVREVFRLLKDSKAAAPPPADCAFDPAPMGLSAIRDSLETIIRYAAQQGLIPRAYAVDELFDDVTRRLA